MSMKLRLKSPRGAELIEFALVFPLLLLVVLGIVDFGFLFQRMEVVTNAAREGARLAVLPGYGTSPYTDAKSRACNFLQNGGVPITGSCPTPTNPTISVTPTTLTLASGATVSAFQVDVVYTSQYLFLTPMLRWFGGSISSVPVKGRAVMVAEPGS